MTADRPVREDNTAYNAGVISALEKELIGPWERERLNELPRWAQLTINSLIKRIANLRKMNTRHAARETEIER